MIRLININKYYQSSQGPYHALKDINLKLPDKGMIYIVGKSGSGKSTLLNVIGGIDKYDSGELWLDNTFIDANNEIKTESINTKNFTRANFNTYRNSYIGFIFQEFNVIKSLTVKENIELSLELQQKSLKEYSNQINSIIEKVGLQGKENRRINELSGGERQRVAIARALIKNPKIIIADEPTGNLDAKNRDIVMNILKELSKEKLILIVTHDKTLASRYGDRQITIKDGEVIDDIILHEENIINKVPSNYSLKPIKPKAKVSFHIALKGFKLNKIRFIFIIILFSLSIVFAGSVINLYLADTTKEYASFQKEYSNFVVNLSEKYTYRGETVTTAFFNFDLNNKAKYFNIDDKPAMKTFTSMKVSIPLTETSINNSFFKDNIEYITTYEDIDEINQNFTCSLDYSVNDSYPCIITDYLADNLIKHSYFDSTITKNNITGQKISFPGAKNSFTIEGIIKTNYGVFYNRYQNGDMTKDEKYQAAFEDNLTIYNSLFVKRSIYEKFFVRSNIFYYLDDILYANKNSVTRFDNVKFCSYSSSNTIIKGNAPLKPLPNNITQVAVSKGFIEQVLKRKVENTTFINEKNNSFLTLNNGIVQDFYLCGISRIPTSTDFLITGIIDNDDIVIYTPAAGESNLYNSWISSTFIEGGFLTTLINSDEAINSTVYRTLLDNKITINNTSFIKLQLVDNFISENIFMFAALFFAFCLFSVLLIFNFIIINIKNSTRDIGIYMSLGMNGFKISLIYLFQILIISTFAAIIGIIGSIIFLISLDSSFNRQALVDFSILKVTFLGVLFSIILAYITPILAIVSPLLSLSRKKPVDVLKAA